MSDDGKTRIRFADEADAAVIARIHMNSRSATMPYLPPQKRSHEQVTQWVRDVLLKQCRTWVAVRNAEIMGYAALDGDVLEHLYLRPDVRRQGIGTLLLDEVKRHSPDGVFLHVFQQNTDARAFYERHGFTVFDTSDGDRNMENLPDMTLRWTPDSAHRGMDDATRANKAAWEAASVKHVREYDDLLAQAASGSSLTDVERDLLAPVLREAPEVVHLQSGHGLDDVALVRAGARSVVGVDYSQVAAGAAQRRAHELGVPCRYVVGEVPAVPLAGACADLVYTGKGALIWMPDLTAWARCAARLLRPSGHLFVYEEHPAAPLWTWDEDRPRIRDDRDYFGRSHVNDTFPGHGAVQRQSTLGQVVTAVASAGLRIVHLGEYAEPFWRMGGVSAAAWNGRLPNAYALLARLPG